MENQRQIFIGAKNGLHIFYEIEKNNCIYKSYLLKNKWVSSISDSGKWITTLTGEIFYNKDGFTAKEYSEPALCIFFPKHRVWYVHEHENGVLLAGTNPAGIYRSKDNGINWEIVQSIKNLAIEKKWMSHQGHAHLLNIIKDPKKQTHIYAGIEVAGVHKSEDSGETWIDITFNLNPDVHKIAFLSEELFATTGSGVYKFENSKKSWTKINGLPLKYVQGLSMIEQKKEFCITSAKKPFGRWRINLNNNSNNEFGIFKYSIETGLFKRLNEQNSQLHGAMSKALCSSAEGEVFYGALNGIVTCFHEDSQHELIKINGQIECLKLHENGEKDDLI